jgi:hypothetical protein
MPSKSKKQHRFMQAVEHSVEFSKKVGVPQSVAEEFTSADAKKGRKSGKRAGKKVSSKY